MQLRLTLQKCVCYAWQRSFTGNSKYYCGSGSQQPPSSPLQKNSYSNFSPFPMQVRLFCNYFQVFSNKTLDLVAMKIAVSGFIANPFSYVLFRSIFKRTLQRSFSQMQTSIGNKMFPKPQSNKAFRIKVSRIHLENSNIEPSKFVTDIFDPNFTHIRSKTLETII